MTPSDHRFGGESAPQSFPLLVDPMSLALPLPWQIEGSPATEAQVVDAWQTVKARQDLVLHGAGAYASLTQARLTNAAVDDLTRSKAGEMEAHLVQRFANWDDLPVNWP
jgi:hypothetical protein